MKRIFKKIHNQDSNRTNQTTPSSLPNAPPTPTSSSHTAINTPGDSVAYSTPHTDDYFASEEEFQVQLALAISASNSEFGDDRGKDRIDAATLLSLERGGIRIGSKTEAEEAAESLSRRYWDYNVLDYDDKVINGFYDLCGLSTDPASQGNMPSLADLHTSVDHGFEAIVVNRTIDPSLEELHQITQCIACDTNTNDKRLLVQRLANLVTEHLGGPVMDANIMQAMWLEKIMELRTSLHQSILPIGSLNIGLSRHRSLLFKVLADDVGIPCRLVKGSHYTGNDDDAVNIIKLENEREFLVDLMADPGTLIPSEILNTKGASINSCSTRIGENLGLQSDGNLGADCLSRDILSELGNEKSLVENYIPKNENSGYKMIESVTPVPIPISGELPTSICNSTDGNSVFVAHSPRNQSHPSSPSVLESYLQHKEKQGELNLVDVKENHNVVPPSPDSTKELENLFADLNPFQMIGSGRPIQTKHTNDRDIQKKPENIVSGDGRPPSPLIWKNHTTFNDVPRTKQYDFVAGLLPRRNQEVKNTIASSMTSTSSKSSDKDLEFHNVSCDTSCVSYPWSTNISVGHPSGGGELISTSLDQSTNPDKDGNQTTNLHHVIQSPVINLQNQYYRDLEVSQKDTIINSERFEKNDSDEHDCKNDNYERNVNAEVMLGFQVDTGPSRLDPMLEDVAEWEIQWEDLVVSERIGLGSYGEVFRADWKGTEVAVKKFLDQDILGDSLDEFRSEVRIMRRLRHPNVVLFLGAVTRPPNLSIITEFLPRGSLYRILHRPNSPIDERHRIEMALDVAQGMNCLHTSVPTVVHRDLKSPNLLVDDNWNVKVCDFGLSRLKHNTFLSSKSTAGTPEWMAPEVLRNEKSNEKCDVYSFGVILWELATLRKPWIGLNPMQVVGAVGFQNRRLEIPKEVDPLVAKIIWACWQTDPNLRPSFAELTATLGQLQRLVVPSNLEQKGIHL